MPSSACKKKTRLAFRQGFTTAPGRQWRVQSDARAPCFPLLEALASPQPPVHGTCVIPCGFFFNDTAPPEIYPLSLPDALPIWICCTLAPFQVRFPPHTLRAIPAERAI